jgi:hypothetical protein
METTKSKLENVLEQSLKNQEIVILEDFLVKKVFDVSKPFFKALNDIPNFDQEYYQKKHCEDFSFLFLTEDEKLKFLQDKYDKAVEGIKRENFKIEEDNKDKIERWNKQKEVFYENIERENSEIKKMYSEYTEGKAKGVVSFFLKIIGNMESEFFDKKNFILSFEEEEKQLNIKFVFPDKNYIFINQDCFSPISSIDDESFLDYYLRVLFLIFKNILYKIINNDVDCILNTLFFEGYIIEREMDSSKVITKKKITKKKISVHTPINDDILLKLEEFSAKEFFYKKNIDLSQEYAFKGTVEIEDFTNSDEFQKVIRDTVHSYVENKLDSIKKTLFDYVDSKYETISKRLSVIEESMDIAEKEPETENIVLPIEEEVIIEKDVEPVDLDSPESSLETKDWVIFDKISDLSIPLKGVFFRIVKLLPNQTYHIDSIGIEKLKLLKVMSNLSYMGIPLIKVTGNNSEFVSWGEDYPKELVDSIIKKYA